jgi:hypothetical protein
MFEIIAWDRKHLIEKSLAEKKCVDDNQYYYQQEKTELVLDKKNKHLNTSYIKGIVSRDGG